MSDVDDEFDKAFEGFGEEKLETPEKPEVKKEEEKPEISKEQPEEKHKEEPEKEAEDTSGGEEKLETPEKPEVKVPAETEEEETPEPPKPLTKEDVQSVVGDLLNTERTSSKELERTTQDVLDAYYPEGLSNVLVDKQSGLELRSPQDVVDLYSQEGQEISHEKAAQWLMNEQYKLDQSIAKIKNDAQQIAETTLKFQRDSQAVLTKYEPLFKKYPHLEQKVYDKFIEQVEVDKDKRVVLKAPDVMDFYDFALEPYQMALDHETSTPAPEEKPEPPKPKAEDRMDESGDGGQSEVDDPNDFAQQVRKQLEKGL